MKRSQPELGPIDAVWRRGGADYLPLRLVLVAKLLDLNVARLLAAHSKLSVAEWRVVAQLGVLRNASVREMARQACIDPAEASRSIGSLERRGYVERHANPRDRRSPRFSLTAAGVRHFAAFRPHWKRFQRALVGRLSRRDRLMTERALALIASAALDLLGNGSRAGAGDGARSARDGSGPQAAAGSARGKRRGESRTARRVAGNISRTLPGNPSGAM